jgi:hypothetical protein
VVSINQPKTAEGPQPAGKRPFAEVPTVNG